MADSKISALTALAGSAVDKTADYIPIIDASEADADKNKRILLEQLCVALDHHVGRTHLKRAADVSISNLTWTAVSWDTEVVDYGSAWSSGTDITVPTGVTAMEVHFYMVWANASTGSRTMRISQAGTDIWAHTSYSAFQNPQNAVSPRLPVTAGSALQVLVYVDGGARTLYGNASGNYGASTQVDIRWFK